MKIRTIKDLKEHLQNILDELEDFDDEDEVVMVENTYWLKGGTHFLATTDGFIDLDYPIEEEECEWCGDTFSKKDMIHKGKWCLCEQCFSYLESRGEDFDFNEKDED